ncbi:Hsp20/alpha crystallin family protein [Bacillus sp. PS06]|uniref:Hsp20/alpha crystallin family protein n=1 Tax=Bacillus sp. PS06 TaxID=2764176 RepID=UPI001786247A|nr:Hsp20/alpha crystallin family protein [Bacillus sp. PS06]MBD8070199.1 Hsp20/alpha crystallin family protein [Bacillus sp. PS06]
MSENQKKQPSKKHQPISTNPLMKSMNDFFNQIPVKRLMESIDEFFEQPFPIPTFAISMKETDQALVITADLPGIKKEQINLDYSPRAITISIKHEEDVQEKNEKNNYYFRKQSFNQSSRTIPLPFSVDERQINASYKNGQLIINIPRPPRRQIKITD